MVSAFRQKVSMLFFLNALLLPLAILSKDIISSGTFMLLFILVQAMLLIIFLARTSAGFYEWYTFWATGTGAAYMFLVLVNGRSVGFEVLGFLLLIGYIASGIIFLLRKKDGFFEQPGPVQADLSDDEIESFRQKDEFGAFQEYDLPDAPKQRHLNEFDDFRRQKAPGTFKWEAEWDESNGLSTKDENEGYYEIKAEDDEESNEGYIELYPDDRIKRESQTRASEGVQVVELKEAPKIEVTKLRESMRSLDEGVKNLNDKVRLIAEKAILEGAEKRLRKELSGQKKASPKKEEAHQWLYASNTGNKYHYKRSCMSLRRVKKKDLLLFEDSLEARRKGLKACGLCRR